MRPADRAWLTLAAGVVIYDIAANEGETLSEGADRAMLRHPWLVRVFALALAGHVCNLVPARFDLIHRAFGNARTLYPRNRKE